MAIEDHWNPETRWRQVPPPIKQDCCQPGTTDKLEDSASPVREGHCAASRKSAKKRLPWCLDGGKPSLMPRFVENDFQASVSRRYRYRPIRCRQGAQRETRSLLAFVPPSHRSLSRAQRAEWLSLSTWPSIVCTATTSIRRQAELNHPEHSWSLSVESSPHAGGSSIVPFGE